MHRRGYSSGGEGIVMAKGFKLTGKLAYDGFQTDYYVGKTNLCNLLGDLEGKTVTITVSVKRRA